MIRGFEQYTAPLTEYQINVVVPRVAAILKDSRGKAHAKTNEQMRRALAAFNITVKDAEMRAVINYIRVNHIVKCVLASGNGYYVATEVNELEEYCRSLQARCNSITQVKLALLDDVQGRIFL